MFFYTILPMIERHAEIAGSRDHSLSRLRRRPWWSWLGVAGITVLAAALFIWSLSRNSMGNTYYAAAVRSATLSWKAWFFGCFDPNSFITVDKLPASLWVQGLFARVFGFSSWSILLPQALSGVASVLILHHLVRRWQGEIPALVASVVFALTPVAVAVFRLNLPDALLTLLFLLAAWALWGALEGGSTAKLVLCGVALGFAFLTKMMEALLVVPSIVLVYLVCGPGRVGRRLLQLLGTAVTALVTAGWYLAVVELWPQESRPHTGGSADDTIWGLIFSRSGGYLGAEGPVPNFAGAPGWLRLLNHQFGGQIGWLVPLALLGLVAGLWLTRNRPRVDRERAGFLLWGLWLVVGGALFSLARGVVHPYYAVVLAPAMAALVGVVDALFGESARSSAGCRGCCRQECWVRGSWLASCSIALRDMLPGFPQLSSSWLR
ncbi:MAG: glycosyltransferase family 39 protein [Thermoleophilia bacterium]|nr:glycosyltransferase family 39 protein [Thermoleophilia bacterium]